MKKLNTLFVVLLLVVGLTSTAEAKRSDRTLIVMPVRYTVVQFAFDVARIRPVELLAYDAGVGDEPLLLHVWDNATGSWQPTNLAAYMSGALFTDVPRRILMIGETKNLPSELAVDPEWARDVTHIDSLKVVDMANTMNAKMKFSAREWKRLAARHQLKIVDENADERRYGRYGKPGTEYTGPRPVNPLVARIRSIMNDDTATEDDAEDSIEQPEAVEDQAVTDEVAEPESEAAEMSDAAPQEESAEEPPATAAQEIEADIAPFDK